MNWTTLALSAPAMPATMTPHYAASHTWFRIRAAKAALSWGRNRQGSRTTPTSTSSTCMWKVHTSRRTWCRRYAHAPSAWSHT